MVSFRRAMSAALNRSVSKENSLYLNIIKQLNLWLNVFLIIFLMTLDAQLPHIFIFTACGTFPHQLCVTLRSLGPIPGHGHTQREAIPATGASVFQGFRIACTDTPTPLGAVSAETAQAIVKFFTPLARHEAGERQCLINRHISISSFADSVAERR